MPAFLLVDSDRNFRRAIEVGLRLDGVEVESAGSVPEALTLLARCRFDLAAVDTLVEGAEALLPQSTAAGALTVAVGPHPELLARAARLHGVRTLEKPFGAPELLRLLRAAQETAAA